MSWQVRRDGTGLWVVVAPSGQVFGVFSNEVEARDAEDVLALVRGSVGEGGRTRLGNQDVTRLRAAGDDRPAPQGADRCPKCKHPMRRQGELPVPGWRVRSGVGLCQTCVARLDRNALDAVAEEPLPADHPVLAELARAREARAQRRIRAEHARMADYARRLALKRLAS